MFLLVLVVSDQRPLNGVCVCVSSVTTSFAAFVTFAVFPCLSGLFAMSFEVFCCLLGNLMDGR